VQVVHGGSEAHDSSIFEGHGHVVSRVLKELPDEIGPGGAVEHPGKDRGEKPFVPRRQEGDASTGYGRHPEARSGEGADPESNGPLQARG
jgi:hypothetical protein